MHQPIGIHKLNNKKGGKAAKSYADDNFLFSFNGPKLNFSRIISGLHASVNSESKKMTP